MSQARDSVPDLRTVGIVDTMIGFAQDPDKIYASLRAALRDNSRNFEMPASTCSMTSRTRRSARASTPSG